MPPEELSPINKTVTISVVSNGHRAFLHTLLDDISLFAEAKKTTRFLSQ